MVCWKVISALEEKLKVEPGGELLSAGAGRPICQSADHRRDWRLLSLYAKGE